MTSDRSSPVGASAYLIGARVAVNAISWTGTLLVIRALSEADWGAYTLIISMTSILDMIVNFQLSRLVVVELVTGHVDAGKTMGSFLTLRLCLSTVGYGLALGIAALGPYPSSWSKPCATTRRWTPCSFMCRDPALRAGW